LKFFDHYRNIGMFPNAKAGVYGAGKFGAG